MSELLNEAFLQKAVGADAKKSGGGLLRGLFKDAGAIVRGAAGIIKTTYAFSTAPAELRVKLKALWRQWPHMRLKLLNLWVLLYEDIEKKDKYNIIYYGPNGERLVQSSISKQDAESFGATTEKAATKKEKATAQEKEVSRQKVAPEEPEQESLKSYLDSVEEEILNEAFGLPPMRILLARWKYNTQNSQILRYRLWVVQVFDKSRNKTYIFVYDGTPNEQPIHKFSYEGEHDILGAGAGDKDEY